MLPMGWLTTPIPGTECCSANGRFDSGWTCGHICEQLTTAGWIAVGILAVAMVTALAYTAISLLKVLKEN